MRIKVTSEDIANGKRAAVYGCPVALAINRHLNQETDELTGARVFQTNIDPGPTYFSDIPSRDVAKRIKKFDNGGDMEPFGFNLRVVRKF